MKTVTLFLLCMFISIQSGVFEDLQPGHWAAVSLNTIMDMDPADDPSLNPNYPNEPPWGLIERLDGMINNWVGGAFATGYGSKGGLIVFGGGHNAYAGGELYIFNLGTRLWDRVGETGNHPCVNDSYGEYCDGVPCALHTYDYVEYHPTTNSFVSIGSAANPVCGGCRAPYSHLFNLDTKTWKRGVRQPSSYIGYTGASSAYISMPFLISTRSTICL